MKGFVVFLSLSAFPLLLRAQDEFSEATEAVNGFYVTMAGFLKGVMCILFLFSLVKMIFCIQKGEDDSVRKLVWWLVAYAAGFVLIDVLVRLL